MAIERPKLKLHRGSTYVFDVSDSSLSSHPLKFTNDSGTSEYTTGITTSGTSGTTGATVTFAVPNDAPDNLMYYCLKKMTFNFEVYFNFFFTFFYFY